MLIKIKKDGTLIFKKFKIKCSIGKSGIKRNKKEGDKATPKGTYSLGKLYYRPDRINKIKTFLKKKSIKKNMGWCNDPKSKKYNKEIIINSKIKYEKLFREDHKYDAFITINYNKNPVIPYKGSAIFLHLTKNYKHTAGCIAIKRNDFLKLAKIINVKTQIRI